MFLFAEVRGAAGASVGGAEGHSGVARPSQSSDPTHPTPLLQVAVTAPPPARSWITATSTAAPGHAPCKRATARTMQMIYPPPRCWRAAIRFLCSSIFKPNTSSAYEIRLFIFIYSFLALTYLGHKVGPRLGGPTSFWSAAGVPQMASENSS